MTTAPAMDTGQSARAEYSASDAERRASRLGAWWTLYWLTLRQHLHGKRWMAVALAFILPAGLAILIRTGNAEVPPRFLEFGLMWVLIPQALLPLTSLLYSSGIVQDEQEEQTITYLLTRPTPKWLIYLIKLAATWTTTVVLVIALTALTSAAIYAATDADINETTLRSLKIAAILSLAAITYCSIFGLMSLITKRTLIAGVLYTAVVEGLLANLPLSLRWGTVLYHTRIIAYRTLEFVAAWPGGRQEDPASGAWSLNADTDPTLAEHPTLRTSMLILIGTSIVCAALAAWLCSQREFHVKTPEKE
ncbi:MAG TPA: ABC transporter permease subunit [Lacipirellulaceae bacterium]|nr:ABC transporter permease subunit [Lacipirellulaceae bacterium]